MDRVLSSTVLRRGLRFVVMLVASALVATAFITLAYLLGLNLVARAE